MIETRYRSLKKIHRTGVAVLHCPGCVLTSNLRCLDIFTSIRLWLLPIAGVANNLGSSSLLSSFAGGETCNWRCFTVNWTTLHTTGLADMAPALKWWSRSAEYHTVAGVAVTRTDPRPAVRQTTCCFFYGTNSRGLNCRPGPCEGVAGTPGQCKTATPVLWIFFSDRYRVSIMYMIHSNGFFIAHIIKEYSQCTDETSSLE